MTPVTLHMYARSGELGAATVTGGKVEPGGDEVVTRAIETSARLRKWPAEAAVKALDGAYNGYWCYSTSDVNPFTLPPVVSGAEAARAQEPADDLTRWDTSQHPRDRHGRWIHAGMGASLAPAAEASPERFAAAFERAFRGSPYSAFVNHYSPADIKAGHMLPLLAEGGKAGILIHDHGDGRVEPTGLFNVSGNRGAGLALLRRAIREHGANYIECYGPVLPRLYGSLGFTDRTVFPFDKSMAAPGWDYVRFDNPPYHVMEIAGVKRMTGDAAPAIDLAQLAAAAKDADPAWWARYGKQALNAALVAAGIEPPSGPVPYDPHTGTVSRGMDWGDGETTRPPRRVAGLP